MAATRESITRLGEYKQSLITAAVTGELDVTTAGSGIPG
jgi:type I restriction enzyme S subunit